jgi:multisubunit Na+/H+ antiporter MnhF subunit
MERLKRNPATLGLILGGAIVAASTFFAWLVVESRGGDDRVVAINTVAGQTIFFLGAFASVCGLMVMLSLGKGKYVWATLGMLAAGAVAAAALWGLVDADGFAAWFADVEAPSARAAIGLFIGLGGGVLAVLGALFSYRFTPPVAE